MRHLHKLHIRVAALAPVDPPLDMFKTGDKVHEYADNPLKLPVNEIQRHKRVLSETTKDDTAIRISPNGCNRLRSGFHLRHRLTSGESEGFAKLTIYGPMGCQAVAGLQRTTAAVTKVSTGIPVNTPL